MTGCVLKPGTRQVVSMRLEEMEQQLSDVRDHYVKKVRELHRKLEHYEYGSGRGDLALRDMEGVLENRDLTVRWWRPSPCRVFSREYTSMSN